MTTRQMAARLTTSQTNVRYWLNRHHLRTSKGPHGRIRIEGPRLCVCCHATDAIAFSARASRLCRQCKSDETVARQRRTRHRAVLFLGGACHQCGYTGPDDVFDIHHLDPTTKDRAFNSMRSWGWARVERELKKCVLLCKNCHALEHARQTRERFKDEGRMATY